MTTTRNRLWGGLFCGPLVLALLAAACAPAPTPAPTSPGAPAVAATSAAGTGAPTSARATLAGPTLTVTPRTQAQPERLVVSQLEETRDLATINPLLTMDIPIPTLLVYDTLVRRSPRGEVVPLLAEKIERPEPTRWRLRLRDGVAFHDGSVLDAEDVRATLDTILNPRNGSGYARLLSTVDRVEVVDRLTVDLVTKVPNELLPGFLAPIPILSGKQLAKGDDSYKSQLIGTGAYTLAEWRQRESVRLARNPRYWGPPAGYDEVLVKTVPEPSTRLADLLSGAAGLAGDLLPEQVPQLKDRGFTVVREPGVRTAYLAFTHKPPFTDARVRRALYHAIDRRALASGLFGEFAEPAVAAVPSSFSGFVEAFPLSDFDPARARALLTEAGVPTPVRASLDVTADMAAAAQLLQAQVRDAGFDLQINVVDARAALFDAKRAMAGAEGRLLMTTALDNRMFDAQRPFEAMYGADAFIKQYGYQPDPRNQALLDRYIGDPDPARRRETSLELQRNAKEQMPVVWLYYPDHVFGVAPSVCWRPGGLGQITFWDVNPCSR